MAASSSCSVTIPLRTSRSASAAIAWAGRRISGSACAPPASRSSAWRISSSRGVSPASAEGPAGGGPRHLQWIQASVGQAIQMIAVDEVLFFISDEKYTRVQTATLEALIRKPIKELVDELDPHKFWQIHRSTLVNAGAIASVTRDFRGRQVVAVRGRPEKLEVSRSYVGLFKGM